MGSIARTFQNVLTINVLARAPFCCSVRSILYNYHYVHIIFGSYFSLLIIISNFIHQVILQ